MTEADTVADAADEVRRTLEERARALAVEPESVSSADLEGRVSVLVVALGAERYALEVRHVHEIRPLSLVPAPGLPAVWAGLTTLRGSVVPILDLARYLEIGRYDPAPDLQVALVASGDARVGLMIDAVVEVREVPSGPTAPPLFDSPGAGAGTIRGMSGDMVAMLDVEALLGDPSIVVDDEPA